MPPLFGGYYNKNVYHFQADVQMLVANFIKCSKNLPTYAFVGEHLSYLGHVNLMVFCPILWLSVNRLGSAYISLQSPVESLLLLLSLNQGCPKTLRYFLNHRTPQMSNLVVMGHSWLEQVIIT